MNRSSLLLLLATLASCTATPEPAPPAVSPQPLGAADTEGSRAAAPDPPLARWEEMLEPYQGDPSVVERRLRELFGLAHAAWSIPRSAPQFAGGRTFWLSKQAGQAHLCIREASGSDLRELELPTSVPASNDGSEPWVVMPPPRPSPNGAFVAVPLARSSPAQWRWAIVEAERGQSIIEFSGREDPGPDRSTPLVWSSDSTAVFLAKGDELGRLDLASGAWVPLLQVPEGSAIQRILPAGDGSRLLTSLQPRGEVIAIDLQGGPTQELTRGVSDLAAATGPAIWIVREPSQSDRKTVELLDLTRPGASAQTLLSFGPSEQDRVLMAQGRLVVRSNSETSEGQPVCRIGVYAPSGTLLHELELPSHERGIRSDGRPDEHRVSITSSSDFGQHYLRVLDTKTGALGPAHETGKPLILAERFDEGEQVSILRASGGAQPDDAPTIEIDFTDLQQSPWTAQVWPALGGVLRVVRKKADPIPTTEDPLPYFWARLIELGLQPRADVIDRLRARGDL
ncbi:MAG: hypothetical protein AAFZ65_09435 [Planctomycetota bacterium]